MLEVCKKGPLFEPKFIFYKTDSWKKIDKKSRDAFEFFIKTFKQNIEIYDTPSYFKDIKKYHQIIHETDMANNFQNYYKKSKNKLSKEMQSAISRGMKYSAKDYAEAIDFMKFFYEHDNYRRYAQSVPIHLLPIYKTLYEDVAYLQQTPEFENWRFWVDVQQKFISEGNSRSVIEWDDLKLPYLGEVAGSGILVDMVSDVITERRTPREAAERAQKLAEKLIEDMGYKRW